MGAVIESAVNWAVGIANDNSHGYDQNSRWGVDYDCSSLVISAFSIRHPGKQCKRGRSRAPARCVDFVDTSSGKIRNAF